MTATRQDTSLLPLALDQIPGLGGYARAFAAGAPPLPTAAPPLQRQPPVVQPGGVAWGDAAFVQELRERHLRLGASEASMRALDRLARGEAACVVTGQQPGLLGGPLYCAYKIAGAVALARRLQERTQIPVVPVYWCGADDSDFDEARGVWLFGRDAAPMRAELARTLAKPGEQVGRIAAAEVARVERGALQHLAQAGDVGRAERALDHADRGGDFGERVAALFLSLFGEAGLVSVDARSPRLLQLGRPLFLRHAREAAEHAAAVDHTGQLLARAGLPIPLAPAATRCGLFAVREGIREKLEPQAATRAIEAGETVAPSVLLRPLLQDALLAPAAAVLGPSELAYHAQIAPLYLALGVRAASPAPRPHVTLWPAQLPLPAAPEQLSALLAGGDPAREILSQLATPPAWRAAGDRARQQLHAAIAAFLGELGEAGRAKSMTRALDRVRREWDQAERALAEPALAQRAQTEPAWRGLPEWLAVRGTPQERAYAAVTAWWRHGDAFDHALQQLALGYVDALERGGSTGFVLRLPTAGVEARGGGAT